MKILYIENIRLPTEKAHGIQIIKMCEAFANLGHNIVLLVPKRKNTISVDPFEYYGIKKNFQIKKIWVPNILFLGSLGFWLQTLFFSEMSAWFVYFFKPDIVYSREERILFNLVFIVKNMIWESHRGSWNFATRIVTLFAKRIVVISKGLEGFYNKKKKNLSSKIILAPDGVDLSLFQFSMSKEECRMRLGLPSNKKIILYSGHLYKWKGVDTLAESSKEFNDGELIVFVGGMPDDIRKFREKYIDRKNILILGQKPYQEIPIYLKSADVLILPNSMDDDIGGLYTSPLKLFEYMASGTPIVASNVPALCEVLNDSNSTFFNPDDSYSLYHSIQKVLMNNGEIQEKSIRAREDVKKYTWNNRAQKIISSIFQSIS